MVSIEVRSVTEKLCSEGLDLIFRKIVDMWTLREHYGCLTHKI